MDLFDRALVVFSHTRADDVDDVIGILCGMASAADLLGHRTRRDRTIELVADLLADARLKRRCRPD
jgi:hypothetical protein